MNDPGKRNNHAGRCTVCGDIPEMLTIRSESHLAQCLAPLTRLEGEGRYYRGSEMQLSTFRLVKCPACTTYFELTHSYYSDPESTMGLYRDEDDWYELHRLGPESALERLGDLARTSPVNQSALRKELRLARRRIRKATQVRKPTSP